MERRLRSVMSRAVFEAPDRAGCVPHWRDGQRRVDAAAVLGHAHRLKMLDALASADVREEFVFFGLAFRREQHPDGLSDKLSLSIPE